MSENIVSVSVRTENVFGEGPNLYAVSIVSIEEGEDSETQLWRGNSEDHALDQAFEKKMEIDEVEEEEINEYFSFEVKFVGKAS